MCRAKAGWAVAEICTGCGTFIARGVCPDHLLVWEKPEYRFACLTCPGSMVYQGARSIDGEERVYPLPLYSLSAPNVQISATWSAPQTWNQPVTWNIPSGGGVDQYDNAYAVGNYASLTGGQVSQAVIDEMQRMNGREDD
jgi:hypothetical protein